MNLGKRKNEIIRKTNIYVTEVFIVLFYYYLQYSTVYCSTIY